VAGGPIRKGASTGVLATKLYPRLASREGNLFCSPYSISVALAMCQAGASGATRDELETALGLTGAGDSLVEAFGELRQVLESRARPTPLPFRLSIASALWCQTGYRLKREFVEMLGARLGVEVREADLATTPGGAAREVNAWVSEATRGRIREILSEADIGALSRAILANAIYFKAPWLSQFEKEATRTEPFQLHDGRAVDAPMMHDTASRRYARGNGFRALEVPYGNDWIVMLLVLPDEGRFDEVERSLDFTALVELTRRVEPVRVALTLPRFRVESSFALRKPLERMGIVEAFSAGADFTRISDESGFALGEVLHKAVVDVDEKGTEAAAATAVMMLTATRAPKKPPPPLEFRVDRPFLFLIGDKPTGTVLFVGRVLTPLG
jgi:serpin B